MTETKITQDHPHQIEVDGIPLHMNGDGLWHDLNIFILIVRKFRWLFLTVFVLACLISFWYLKSHATYSAKARFMITDWSTVCLVCEYIVLYTRQTEQNPHFVSF